MPRRATPLDPADGPEARFALALRQLRDQAGFEAKTIDAIAAENYIPRSTLYAAMRGKRIPTVPVLAALVQAWNGDPVKWLAFRTETEQEVERLRRQGGRQSRRGHHQGEPQSTPAEQNTQVADVEQEGTAQAAEGAETEEAEGAQPSRESAWAWLPFDEIPTEVYFEADSMSELELLDRLTNPSAADRARNWEALRAVAGLPTLRDIAREARMRQTTVRGVLSGNDLSGKNVQKVLRVLKKRRDEVQRRRRRYPDMAYRGAI